MSTTQTRSLLEIESQISIMNLVKNDLLGRLQSSNNAIHKGYLREKIKGINTELRIMQNIRSAFLRTILKK